MDQRVKSVDGSQPLPSAVLSRVQGVAGVSWASPLLSATTTVNTDDGNTETVRMLGVDDSSLIGLP